MKEGYPIFLYKESLLIVAEGADSYGISGTGETPQGAKRLRRLTARPMESIRLKRKSPWFICHFKKENIGLYKKRASLA